MSAAGPMQMAGVGLVLEAMHAIKVAPGDQAFALNRVGEILEANAAQVSRCAAGSAVAAGEAFVAELRAEAARFRGAAERMQGEARRQAAEAEAGEDKPGPALAPVEGGKGK